MPQNDTIVTYCYVRDNEEYSKCMELFNRIQMNIIFFVSKENEKDIKLKFPPDENRNYDKKRIIMERNELKYSDQETDMDTLIGINKLLLVKKAIELNPFESEYFAWLDFNVIYKALIPDNTEKIFGMKSDKLQLGILSNIHYFFPESPNFYRNQQKMICNIHFKAKKDNILVVCDLFDKEVNYVMEKYNLIPSEHNIFIRLILHHMHLFNLYRCPNNFVSLIMTEK